jgi:hypothetical protein
VAEKLLYAWQNQRKISVKAAHEVDNIHRKLALVKRYQEKQKRYVGDAEYRKLASRYGVGEDL